MIIHREIELGPFPRGIHLVTTDIIRQVTPLPESALLNLFLHHTSAALTINENDDPAVRRDFEAVMEKLVPEEVPWYTHTLEGPDDMPSHVKSSLLGFSLTIPVRKGRPDLGRWQGIYLCEFRNRGGKRRITATLYS